MMNRKQQIRRTVYNMFDGHCAYCGREITIKQMQVDHKVPKYRKEYVGKTIEEEAIFLDQDRIENLFPSCRFCNNYKGAWDIEGFRHMVHNLSSNKHLMFASNAKAQMLISMGIVQVNKWDGKFYFEKYKQKKDESHTD